MGGELCGAFGDVYTGPALSWAMVSVEGDHREDRDEVLRTSFLASQWENTIDRECEP